MPRARLTDARSRLTFAPFPLGDLARLKLAVTLWRPRPHRAQRDPVVERLGAVEQDDVLVVAPVELDRHDRRLPPLARPSPRRGPARGRAGTPPPARLALKVVFDAAPAAAGAARRAVTVSTGMRRVRAGMRPTGSRLDTGPPGGIGSPDGYGRERAASPTRASRRARSASSRASSSASPRPRRATAWRRRSASSSRSAARPPGPGDHARRLPPDAADRLGLLLHEPRRPGLRHDLLVGHQGDGAARRAGSAAGRSSSPTSS